MARTKISEFSATPGNNTDIDGINIAEGCAPSGINDAIRELMSQLKDFQTGAAGDSFNGPVGTTTAAAGAFTTLSSTGNTTLGDASGDTVTVNGTATFANANPTLSAGTANGVAYLNGSKVLTTGSALVFDGSNLGLGVTPSAWGSTWKSMEFGKVGQTIAGFTGSDPLFRMGTNMYTNSGGTDVYAASSKPATQYLQYIGQHQWFTAGSGTAGNAISFTQAMTLDASGNWLLGVTSASGAKLHAESTSDMYARIKTTGNSVGVGLQIQSPSRNFFIGQPYNAQGNLVFYDDTAGAERARIDSSGNFISTAPTTAPALSTNGTMVFNLTSNTNLRISVRGSDGVTRTADITLA